MWKRWVFAAFLVWLSVSAAAVWYTLAMPGTRHDGPLPALTAEERELAGRLRSHVIAIASTPHNVKYHANLEAAAKTIEEVLGRYGHRPIAQMFETGGKSYRNIEVVIEPPGARDSMVIGAHYDSFGDAPGANDNGTGTAMLLELARLLKDTKSISARLRLVFFTNEELPFWDTEFMGSRRYARALAERREPIRAMLSLETLGFFSDVPGSQRYPPPVSLFLPDTANFITFTGTLEARDLVHRAIASFRTHTAFPTIGGVGPRQIKGLDWSDHKSFSREGFPAIMVTDTALFRYAHYHTPQDTPDKVDYEKLARLTKGMERVIRDLAR